MTGYMECSGVIEGLGAEEDFGGVVFGDDDDAVLVGDDDVVGGDVDAVAAERDVSAGEAVVADGGGGDGAEGVDGERELAELGEIADAAVDDGAGEAAGEHGGAHEAAHAGDVRAILDAHDVDGAGGAGVDGVEHAGEGGGVGVFLLDEFDGEGAAGEFGGEDGLHAVRHVAALVKELLDGVRDAGGLDVAVGVEQEGGVGAVFFDSFRGVGGEDVGDGEEGRGEEEAEGGSLPARCVERGELSQVHLESLLGGGCGCALIIVRTRARGEWRGDALLLKERGGAPDGRGARRRRRRVR